MRKNLIRQWSPKKNVQTGIDIIKKLQDRGMMKVVVKIFDNLEGADLHQTSSVSSIWRQVSSKKSYAKKISSYRSLQAKKQKCPNFYRSPNWRQSAHLKSRRFFENRVLKKSPTPKKGLKSPSTRAAMKSRDPKMHHWATVKRDLMFGEEMINCPLCNYPAKKDENGKGICSLQRCQSEFCAKCRKPWHSGECPPPSPPPAKTTSKSRLKKKLKKL